MAEARFSMHGCAVELSSPDPALAASVAADFAAFPAPGPLEPRIRISALPRTPPARRPRALLSTAKWSVLRSAPGTRLVWYPEGALCRYDYRAEAGEILSADPGLLRELSYLVILSRAGEWLDRRGLHRLHAGALALDGRGLLFLGSQGAGKTTLLLELLKDPAFSLLSDDTPLVGRGGLVYPFPARVGLGEDNPHLERFPGAGVFRRRHYAPKRVIAPADAGALCRAPVPARLAFLLRRGAVPRLTPCPLPRAARELALSLVAGRGVPQMAEYFLRPSPLDAAAKAGILASRLRAAGGLLSSPDFWIFETGPDPERNALEFRSFLRNNSGPGSAA